MGAKGQPKTGGRKKGTPNKSTTYRAMAMRSAAMEYADAAIKNLVKIAGDESASESARVSACNAILDRAYGKPVQAISGEDHGPLRIIVQRFGDEAD